MKLDGTRVREERERLALSIENASAKAQVSAHTWVRAEHGEELRPSSVRRIAEALGAEPGQLMGGATAPKAPSRSPLEPSLFNGLEEERRLINTLGPIVMAAEKAWEAHLTASLRPPWGMSLLRLRYPWKRRSFLRSS